MVPEKSRGCFMSFLFVRLVQRENVSMKTLKTKWAGTRSSTYFGRCSYLNLNKNVEPLSSSLLKCVLNVRVCDMIVYAL